MLSPKGFHELFSALEQNESIVAVCIGNPGGTNRNVIGVTGSLALASYIQKSRFLQYLDLRGLGLGDSNCQIVFSMLLGNKTLIYMNVSRNDITNKGAESLSAGLIGSALMQLDLSHNNLGDCGIRAVAQYISHSSCLLQKLVLTNTKFGKVGAQLLFRAVALTKKLNHLNVARNYFQQLNLDRLTFCFQYGPLTTLDISSCDLGAHAMT